MVPWLRKWHLGVGLMGEQGSESVHYPCQEVGGKIAIGWTLKYLILEYVRNCSSLLSLKLTVNKRKLLS